jgi:hypothetical protein
LILPSRTTMSEGRVVGWIVISSRLLVANSSMESGNETIVSLFKCSLF